MQAKPRNTESMLTSKGATRKFYLPNQLYDNLLREADEKGICISKLLREKIEAFEQICFLAFKTKKTDTKE